MRCHAAAADPWATLASGTLLAAFDASQTAHAREASSAWANKAAVIAAAENGEAVINESEQPLAWPERDGLSRVFAQE
jgi:hydrogenase maturation factor